MDDQTPPQQQPRDDEPGGESTPLDTEGAGPVGLQDRTRQRGAGGDDTGAPATNQAKTEPIPATPGQPDPSAPLEPPALGQMNVGAADPQSPRLPAAVGGAAPDGPHGGSTESAATHLGGPGTVPAEDRPVPAAGVSTGAGAGPEGPTSASTRPGAGSAHKAPGLVGRTGSDEAVETDVETSATGMGPATGTASAQDEPGDAQGVPALSHQAAPGTSEQHGVVRGARTPSGQE